MPRVPEYEPQPSKPLVVTPTAGGGDTGLEVAAAGVMRAGMAVSNTLLQIATAKKNRVDGAIVNEGIATVKYGVADILGGPEGAQSVKGKDAMADRSGERDDPRPLTPRFMDPVDQLIRAERAKLKTNDQLAMFDARIPAIRNSALMDLNRMQAEQSNAYEQTAYNANMDAHQDDASRHWGDVIVRNQTLASMYRIAEDRANVLGLGHTEVSDEEGGMVVTPISGDWVDREIVARRSETAKDGFLLMIANDEASKAYAMYYGGKHGEIEYDAYKDQEDEYGPVMTADHQLEVENALGSARDKDDSYGFVRHVVGSLNGGKGFDPTRMVSQAETTFVLEQIRQKYSDPGEGDKLEMAERRFRQVVNDHDAGWKRQHEVQWNEDWDAVNAGALFSDLNPAGEPYRTPQTKGALLEREAKLRDPDLTRRKVSDPAALDYLNNKLSEDEFMEEDLRKWEDRLTPGDYRTMSSLKGRLQRERTGRGDSLRTTLQGILSAKFPKKSMSKTEIDRLFMKFADEVQRVEESENKGKLSIERMRGIADELFGSWMQSDPFWYGPWAVDDPVSGMKVGLRDEPPSEKEISTYYQPISDIPEAHIVFTKQFLERQGKLPADQTEALEAISKAYAQQYLYPLSRGVSEAAKSNLVGHIRESEALLESKGPGDTGEDAMLFPYIEPIELSNEERTQAEAFLKGIEAEASTRNVTGAHYYINMRNYIEQTYNTQPELAQSYGQAAIGYYYLVERGVPDIQARQMSGYNGPGYAPLGATP